MKTPISHVDIFNKIKFSLFADMHYKKGMYISSVKDIRNILDRADCNSVDFVIHVGDMCNDYRRSPELTHEYLENKYGLPVYGIYGNHELESKGNCMELVTPLLCNRKVVWGTSNGELEDGSIGYYYFDIKGFRIVALDTNYSLNPQADEWEHNRTASWGAPAENTKKDSLGSQQLSWLERVLDDAAENGLRCLLFSHVGFSGIWYSSPDTDAVRKMINDANKKRSGTVLMSISGHLHTNNQAMVDGVVHFDVNTTRNGLWLNEAEEHYGDLTYTFTDYDANGKDIATYERPIGEAWMSKQTWFFDSPLSAIVTVDTNGNVNIDGAQTAWYRGIAPSEHYGVSPQISNGSYTIKEDII